MSKAPFDLDTREGYESMLKFLDRLTAEHGDELPELSDPTPRQLAQRLLDNSKAMYPEDWAALEWIASR